MTPRKDGPRTEAHDYPCVRCGTPLDDCMALAYVDGPDARCCDDSDHPYATAAETIRALNADIEAEAAAGPRDDGLDVERLDAAIARFYGRSLPYSTAEGIAREYNEGMPRAALAAATGAAPPESEERRD